MSKLMKNIFRMLSVRSSVNGEILARLSRPMMVGSSRNASYSKNPQMKDGSLRALIYNDALKRGKQHLLRDDFNPNRIGKPEVPASWVKKLNEMYSYSHYKNFRKSKVKHQQQVNHVAIILQHLPLIKNLPYQTINTTIVLHHLLVEIVVVKLIKELDMKNCSQLVLANFINFNGVI